MREPQSHACPHPRCASMVANEHFACRKHWYQLPEQLRGDILSAWRSVRYEQPGAIEAYKALVREAIAIYTRRGGIRSGTWHEVPPS